MLHSSNSENSGFSTTYTCDLTWHRESKLTNYLNRWSRILQKLDRSSNSQEFPACYGTRKFITAFTRACHLSLAWARTIQYMPQSHFLKIHFNIILPSTPVLSKLSVSLRFHQQTPLLSPYMLHVSPISFSWFGHAYYICWSVQIIKLFVM